MRFGWPGLPPTQSSDWWVPLALAGLVTAWRLRAGLALAALAPVAMFWRLLVRLPWLEGFAWWALAALVIGGSGLALERVTSRSGAALLLGSGLVTALGLALSGSVVLAQVAGSLALSSTVLLWRSSPSSRWIFALRQGLLVFSGLHWATLGWMTPLLVLAPLSALLTRWRWGAWVGGLGLAGIAGAFAALWLQDPYL